MGACWASELVLSGAHHGSCTETCEAHALLRCLPAVIRSARDVLPSGVLPLLWRSGCAHRTRGFHDALFDRLMARWDYSAGSSAV
jgi:hypothetical protein